LLVKAAFILISSSVDAINQMKKKIHVIFGIKLIKCIEEMKKKKSLLVRL